ncbi:DUF4492 domain-containing protein [Porphyromonas uenonis]|uniref:DUF4492 domain-containing protein n=1 Tax=Porphyromonas uenonis TaxID=281920 RepID=UPI001EE30CC7|nr:DUF4492 domain-containing protein [Porphyromonas uenonis]
MDTESTDTKGKTHWGLRWFYDLYRDGLRNQSRTSRTLWIIVAIKLLIMFAILRPIFFPRVIAQQGDKEAQIEFVQDQLTAPVVDTLHHSNH